MGRSSNQSLVSNREFKNYRCNVTRRPISETLVELSRESAILLSESCGVMSSESNEKNAKTNANNAAGKPFISCLLTKF